MSKKLSVIASFLLALAVAIGAFGAHALKDYFTEFPKYNEIYKTAVLYHFIHGLAIFAVGWALTQWKSKLISIAGICFIFGVVVFSGSLYILSLTQIGIFGAITPIGGVAFILGWVLLGVGIAKSR
jgi:uncharacterized membrane protein YgdD (TMEM256/DUF423 family)